MRIGAGYAHRPRRGRDGGAAARVLAAAVATWKLGWERYHPADPGPTVPTGEVLVDPETGRRQRVHMNPATGTRVYVDEPAPPGPGG